MNREDFILLQVLAACVCCADAAFVPGGVDGTEKASVIDAKRMEQIAQHLRSRVRIDQITRTIDLLKRLQGIS